MKAGSELDALVAQKVMGLKRWVDTQFPAPYSISIAVAWDRLVVGRLEHHWWVEVYQPRRRWWRVQLTQHGHEGSGTFDLEAEAETLPEAICLVALKTVEAA